MLIGLDGTHVIFRMACKYRKPEAGVAGWIMSWRNCGKQGNAILRTYVQYYYSVTMLRARHTADLNDERNFCGRTLRVRHANHAARRCACSTRGIKEGKVSEDGICNFNLVASILIFKVSHLFPVHGMSDSMPSRIPAKCIHCNGL